MCEKYDIVVHGATSGGPTEMVALSIMMADGYLSGEDDDYEDLDPMKRTELIKEELLILNNCFPVYLGGEIAIGTIFVRLHDDRPDIIEKWLKDTAEISKDYGIRSSKYVLHEDFEISDEFISSFIVGDMQIASAEEDRAGFDLSVLTADEIEALTASAVPVDLDEFELETPTVN